jgi:hypothetical protein
VIFHPSKASVRPPVQFTAFLRYEMARMDDWQREIHEGTRRENWSLRGPNGIVKVLPLGTIPQASLGGYITVGSALLGKTPRQIEQALGLKHDYLAQGARICRFVRLPMSHEYEYELTAAYPDGLAFNPAHGNPDYPPGSPKIHQWRIKNGAQIPVDPANYLDLRPNEKFPYGWLI